MLHMRQIRFVIFVLAVLLAGVSHGQQSVNGQYVLVQLPGVDRSLAIAELEVFSDDRNISPSGIASQSSTYTNSIADRAIDGDTSGDYFLHSVSSTNAERNPWWQLDLGRERSISKIILFNRMDCCREWISPAVILVLDGDKKIVWRGEITDIKDSYTFYINGAADNAQPKYINLLRNSDFLRSSNDSSPDRWGIHNSALMNYQDISSLYMLDDSTESPVSGARTLRVINKDPAFYHMSVFHEPLFAPAPSGRYTFSVYAKSGTVGKKILLSHSLSGEYKEIRIGTGWARYSISFDYPDKSGQGIQPVINFPQNGSYYIAAPQLEYGDHATAYSVAYEDMQTRDVVNPGSYSEELKNGDSKRGAFNKAMQSILDGSSPRVTKLISKYETYFQTEKTIDLRLLNPSKGLLHVGVECFSEGPRVGSAIFSARMDLQGDNWLGLAAPVNKFPIGRYKCTAVNQDKYADLGSVVFSVVPFNSDNVRANHLNANLEVNNSPFQIRGIMIGAYIPQKWYFEDIASKGINTIFYAGTVSRDGAISYDSSVLANAQYYGLKVVLVSPIGGSSKNKLYEQLESFSAQVERLKSHPAILGWYLVDEPSVEAWSDPELINIHQKLSRLDPYHLIFNNWAYDGVPERVGDEPRGSLNSTDIYSTDVYPFQGFESVPGGLDKYTRVSLRALATASWSNKPVQSWLQIYGSNNVWREPTPDELRYMAYLNVMFGSGYSFFELRSLSEATWSSIGKINQESQLIMETLFWNKDAKRLLGPSSDNGFIRSIWSTPQGKYLLVIHPGNGVESYTVDLNKLGFKATSKVESIFDDCSCQISAAGTFQEKFPAYGAKLFKIN